MPQKKDCVKLLVGKFPEDDIVQKLDYGTFDAILCEFVLHFLTEQELKHAFHELALLLKPGDVVKQLEFPAITICNQLIAKRVPTCEIPASGYLWRYFSLLPRLEGGIWNKKLEDEYAKFCQCPNDYQKRPLELVLKNFNSVNSFK
uniref:Methyltransferase type 11 domain-containing protein n=1 Tax=Romanomermis culicivorax TaxID=13658 RepID=A0A915HJ09_ROMCU